MHWNARRWSDQPDPIPRTEEKRRPSAFKITHLPQALASVPCDSAIAVEISRVTCRYGSLVAIDDLSLSIPSRTVVGIVGPNGAGKTTLIDIICGLRRPSDGTVRIWGEDAAASGAKLRARIGMLPQETALYDEVTAWQNLRFFASLYGVPHSRTRIAEVLELVGLRGRADDIVRTFSGGMQRRLAIARALLHDPPLLILDEPTVGVDVEARHRIWAHVRTLRAAGRTVLLTTNYLDEAEALCDRVAILGAGKLLAEDTPSALTARTGRCLELECQEGCAREIHKTLRGRRGVLRVEAAGFGLRAYLAADVNPEDIVREARCIAAVDGFRGRAPDLAEVFRCLAAADEKL